MPESSSGSSVFDQDIGIQVVQQAMPAEGGVVDVPGHGREVWFAYGAMSGNEWTPANGVVTSHVFEDDATIVTMELNIERPKEGTFYEVWMRHPETRRTQSAGHLSNHFNDARHGLKFESIEDLRVFTEITVTLEQDDGKAEASTHVVATGTLKPTKRR